MLSNTFGGTLTAALIMSQTEAGKSLLIQAVVPQEGLGKKTPQHVPASTSSVWSDMLVFVLLGMHVSLTPRFKRLAG